MWLQLLVRFWPALAGALAVLLLVWSHWHAYDAGYDTAEAEWTERSHQSQLERLQAIRDTERRAREAQDAIVGQYTDDMALLKAEHERQLREIEDAQTDLVNAYRPACVGGTYADGMCICAAAGTDDKGRLPSARTDKSGTVCYSEDRLRRQIAETVALGQECDREMMRFKALIEACRKQEADDGRRQ